MAGRANFEVLGLSVVDWAVLDRLEALSYWRIRVNPGESGLFWQRVLASLQDAGIWPVFRWCRSPTCSTTGYMLATLRVAESGEKEANRTV